MKKILIGVGILGLIWVVVPFLGLQTYSIDGVTIYHWTIPHMCGLDWCP